MKELFRKYFEVSAFALGLLLLAMMNPEITNGPSLCLFDFMGITFCPGEGLGHSISYIFRGQFDNAIESNLLGPFAIVIIGGRMVHLLFKNYNYKHK